jgi:iron complex outermembrane receptor protein
MEEQVSNIKNILTINRLVLIVMVIYLSTACPISAQIVEEVEVTGKIFSHDSHSKNMVIISAADLEEFKIKDMAELFSFFTALNTSKRGAGETSFDITMRGGNFEQVLVLVDGVPLNNPQTGHFNSDFPFSLEDVARVEILRGGSSTISGAGAFAGVVHIYLKKMEKNTDLQIKASGGDNKFYSTALYAGKTFKNLGFRVSMDKNKSDGYYDGQEFDNLKFTAGSFYRHKNTEIDLHAGYLKKDFGAAGFYAPYPSKETIKSNFYRLGIKQRFKEWDIALTYSYNKHQDYFILDGTRPSLFQSESDTHLNFLNLSASYKVNGFTASAGAELRGETIDSTSMGNRKRNRGALFLNINLALGSKTGIDVGIRRNFEADENSNFTYYTGLYYRLNKDIMMRAGYGKSFRLPSFTELYYNSPANIGNPLLEPEVSHNYEVSLSMLRGYYQGDLSLFYRTQSNMIDWFRQYDVFSSTFYPWQAVNVEINDIIGIEWTNRIRVNRTMVSLGIEKLSAVNREDMTGFQSKYGFRFPDFTIKAGIIQPIANFAKAAANYTYKHINGTTEKGHFMNLILTVPIGNVELGFRLDNVFDSIIEEIPGLKVPGRWFYMTFAYKM